MAGASGSWGSWTDAFMDIEWGSTWDWVTRAASGPYGLIFGTAADQLAQGVEVLSADAQAQFARLMAAGQEFATNFNALDALGDEVLDTPYATEYLGLLARARTAKDTLDTVASAASSVWGTAKSAFGLSGARGLVLSGARQLGALPALLSVAAIAGVTALLLGLSHEMSQFVINYNLVKQGKPPMTDTGGTVGQIAGTVKWVVIGGAAILLLPQVLGAFGRGR